MSRVFGNVKWYDSKKGYGFVTIVNSESDTPKNDVFVHHSNINVGDGDFKRLFPGEYIEFLVGDKPDGRTEALNVTGICNGILLCENGEYRYKIYPRKERDIEAEEQVTEEPVAEEQVAEEKVAEEPVA